MGLLADLRFAFRALGKRPGFSAVVLVTLALGIGTATVIFSVVDTLLLRPVPYTDPNRLIRVVAANKEIGIEGAGLALGDFRDYRTESQSLEGLVAYSSRDFALTGGDTPRISRGTAVSAGLFSLLRVQPTEGRGFLPQDETLAEGQVVVISHQLRQDYFTAAPVLGRTLELHGKPHRIVGVMPESFHFPNRQSRLWVPLTLDGENLNRMSHYLGAIGRLAPGVTTEQASGEFARIADALAARYPESNTGWTARTVLLTEHLTRRLRPALLALSGAVGLLLLIACANVANLLLVRATQRQKEAAIRTALGSSRGRLVRGVLLESTLLAMLGGALGILLAFWGLKALAAFGPAHLPQLAATDLDWTALLFTLLVTLVAGLAFGSGPALQLSLPGADSLGQGRGVTEARIASRLRAGLVVAEVAVALILVIGASLMLKGFSRLSRIDVGFDPDNVLVLHIVLSPERYPEVPPQAQLFESLLKEARGLPGVISTAAGSAIPLLPAGQNLLPFEPVDGEPGLSTFANFSAVTPDFFKTLKISLVQGRAFRPLDNADAPPVLVVNEELARRFWPGGKAVGQRLLGTIWGSEPISYEVVGVVASVRQQSLAEEPGPAVYAPYLQVPHLGMLVVARASRDPHQYTGPMSQRLWQLDPYQPVAQVTTLEEVVKEAGGRERFYTAMLSLFGGIGLLLATVGIYGVIAYSFARRSQELAIRVALGADSGSIFSLVLREGLKLTLAGITLGLPGALALVGLLSSLLYGVSPQDPWIFALAPMVFLVAALLACCLPALRAVRVDPVQSLRPGL